jgi:hypothetical protein
MGVAPPLIGGRNGGYNMDTIKLLNSLEVGMPLIITTKWQDIINRKVTLFAGANEDGTFNFIDDSTTYKMTPRYIKEHCKISQELDQEDDIFTLTKLIDKVKGGK